MRLLRWINRGVDQDTLWVQVECTCWEISGGLICSVKAHHFCDQLNFELKISQSLIFRHGFPFKTFFNVFKKYILYMIINTKQGAACITKYNKASFLLANNPFNQTVVSNMLPNFNTFCINQSSKSK